MTRILPAILGIVLAVMTCALVSAAHKPQTMNWVEFEACVESGSIASVEQRDNVIRCFKTGEDRVYTLEVPVTDTLLDYLREQSIPVVVSGSTVSSICSTIITIMMIGMMAVVVKRTAGTDKQAVQCVRGTDTKFEDVIGHDEIIKDLKVKVSVLKGEDNPIGVKASSGILFTGEPGVGKTLLAKAVAGEAGLPFIYVNSSEIEGKYVSTGTAQINNIFRKAKAAAPCIVFFDEIDAIGRKRGAGDGSVADKESGRTLNCLLQKLDGFHNRKDIFVIAATNDAASLDKALLRAGRFDREVVVMAPKTAETREKLFELYFKPYKVDETLSFKSISRVAVGFTGADIKTLCNEAALYALGNGKQAIDMDSAYEALGKIICRGNKTKEMFTDNEMRRVAYHEAGHAVMCHIHNKEVFRSSAEPMSAGVGGYTLYNQEGQDFMDKWSLAAAVSILYAGYISEQICCGSQSSGAANDIQAATAYLTKAVKEWGFAEDFSILDVSALNDGFGDRADEAVNKLAQGLYKNAYQTLQEHLNQVKLIAGHLLERKGYCSLVSLT